MLYGTSGDVRNELGNPSENEYSAEDISRARTKATNLVDTYISVPYPDNTPFTVVADVPLIVNTLTDDLAVYFSKRSKHQGPSPLSDTIKEEYYDRSIKVLEQIRDGELELPELQSKKGDSITTTRNYVPIFDVDGELEQSIDPDLTDHISDERDS